MKSEKFNEMRENRWGNEGEIGKIGGSGESTIKNNYNYYDGNLHGMKGICETCLTFQLSKRVWNI